MSNQNVKLIGAEHRELEKWLNIVTRSGLGTDGNQSDNVKNSSTEWVRRSSTKSPTFELQKEKETFLHM